MVKIRSHEDRNNTMNTNCHVLNSLLRNLNSQAIVTPRNTSDAQLGGLSEDTQCSVGHTHTLEASNCTQEVDQDLNLRFRGENSQVVH